MSENKNDTRQMVVDFFSLKQEIEEVKLKNDHEHTRLDTIVKELQQKNEKNEKTLEKIGHEVDNMQVAVSTLSESVKDFIKEQSNNSKNQDDKIEKNTLEMNKAILSIEKRVSNVVRFIVFSVLISLVVGYAGVWWKLDGIENKYISKLTDKHKAIIKNSNDRHKELIQKIEGIQNNKIDIEVIKQRIKAIEKGK